MTIDNDTTPDEPVEPTDGDDQGGDGGDSGGDQQQQPPPSLSDLSDDDFTQRVGSFVFSRTGEEVDDATDISSLLGDTGKMSGVEGYAADLLAERKRREDVAAEAALQAKDELAKSDREATKAALKKRLADEQAEQERVDAEKRREEELLAEIAAEEASAGAGPATTPEDVAGAIVADVASRMEALKSGPLTPDEFEQLGELADVGDAALESLDKAASFKPDWGAAKSAAEERLKKMEEG